MRLAPFAVLVGSNLLFASVAHADFVVEAAVNWSAELDDTSTGTGYLFWGAQYLEYGLGDFTVKNWKETGPDWNLPESWEGQVDAALNWSDGSTYLFRGKEYVRYPLDASEPDGPPKKTQKDWKLPRAFKGQVDAAINWGDGTAFLFRGKKYVRYNVGTMKPVGRPKRIQKEFKLPKAWKGRIDAAVNWGNGTAYLFSGDTCVAYSLADKTPQGEPKDSNGTWVENTSSTDEEQAAEPATE